MIKITKTLSNLDIFNMAKNLIELSEDNLVFPVKINFYLQKNKKEIVELGKELEEQRIAVLDKYGKFDEASKNYSFEGENSSLASKEIKELFTISQEVTVYTVGIEEFGDINLSSKQFSAIEFMIQDEEEDKEEE